MLYDGDKKFHLGRHLVTNLKYFLFEIDKIRVIWLYLLQKNIWKYAWTYLSTTLKVNKL